MNVPHPLFWKPEFDRKGRRLITVEFPTAQAGVAAALRRSFDKRSEEDSQERQFDELLNRLD